MVQIETLPKHLRIRSRFDPRWLLALAAGLVISIAYYALLIWAVLWVVRALWSWVAG